MAEAIHRAADGHHPTARHPSPTTSAARRRMGTDFLNSTAVALAEALLALSSRRGVGLHFIQVGANAGDFLQENVHLNQSSDPVRIAVQRLLRHERTRGLLIEPNPPVFKQLDAAVHREFAASGNAARRVSAQNIAVCAHRTGTVDFYTVDPRIMEDFPQAPYYVRKGELATMSRESITLGLRQIKWARRQGSTRAPEEFILTQQVPCRTPRDVLSSASIAPQALDALVVDAEGLDAEIVESFLNVSQSARPSVIFFEASVARAFSSSRVVFRRLLSTMIHSGYSVRCCLCNGMMPTGTRRLPRSKACDASWNALAWLPSRLQPAPVAAERSGAYGLEWGLQPLQAECKQLAARARERGRRKKPNLAHECARAAGEASVDSWWRLAEMGGLLGLGGSSESPARRGVSRVKAM